MKKHQIVLTGACFFRSGLPTKQSKTTFDPACAHISVLFLPIKRLLVFFVKPSGSQLLMKSTGSTIETFDDNSMPDDRNTEKEKRDKNNISKSLFYHEINNVLQCPGAYSGFKPSQAKIGHKRAEYRSKMSQNLKFNSKNTFFLLINDHEIDQNHVKGAKLGNLICILSVLSARFQIGY